MSKATVLALVDSLSNGQADGDSCANYYDECLQEIAQLPTFVRARVLPVAASDDGLVSWPDDVIEVFYVLYDARPLSPVSLKQLEARSPDWRDRPGPPLAYTLELEQPRTLRLYPKPDVPSKPQSFVYGEPLGRDFPVGSVTLICTTTAELPDWLDLPLALKVLAKEFARESDHRDLKFAQACQVLGDLCWALATGES